MRELFIARWPERIMAQARRRGGRVSHSVATTLDTVPTIARLSNTTLPANQLDGVKIWPVLSGE